MTARALTSPTRLENAVIVLTILALAGGLAAFEPNGQVLDRPQTEVTQISEAGDAAKQLVLGVVYLFNIGLLHTACGSGEHANYAPCSVADLARRGYDYWALGHVHTRSVLSEDPWVVFPGNIQGRHVKEEGSKGATLVTVDGRRVLLQHQALDVLRWLPLDVDATGAAGTGRRRRAASPR